MRTVALLLLVCVALAGCQRGDDALQDRADSLQSANEELRQQVQELQNDASDSQSRPAPTGAEGTTLTPPIYFPSGSAWLFNDAKRKLDEHATSLKQKYPETAFRIKGYTDSVPIGPDLKETYPSNWYLSAQRAAAVAHYLDKEHNVQTQTLEIEAFGPKSPAASNETPEGRKKNRRVEIVVEDGS